MRVKRYTAENIRKAMQLVKDELGDEAIILSNRIVGGLVEIIATEEPPIKRFDTTIMQAKPYDFSESHLVEKNSIDLLEKRIEFFQNTIEKFTHLFEFKMQYQSPYVFYLFNLLYEYGFNEKYAKHLVQLLSQKNISKKEIMENLLSAIQRTTQFSEKETLGNCLFIGPSGSGKTASIAKFATNYRLLHPEASISFVYLDLDKNGGERNLAQYAKLLNTKFSYADNIDVFKQIILNSQGHDLILIDTGFSIKPERYLQVKNLLSPWSLTTFGIVPTTHDNQVLMHYFSQLPIDEIIMTKTDESSKIGTGLSLAFHLNKPISYVSTGVQLANQFCKANMSVITKVLLNIETDLPQSTSMPLNLDEPIIWKMSGAV